MTDVFKVQDEIAAAVVAELKIKLLGAAPKLRETDPQAYALFLQAREVMRQYNPEATEQAIALYKQALDIDPNYAPAWDGLADAYFNQIDLGVTPTDRGLPLMRDAINHALAIDPSYAPVYARAGLIEGDFERDLAAAARHLEQGLTLDPANFVLIDFAVRIARRLGRLDQSIALAEYLVARDPINANGYHGLFLAYLLAGRLDEAIAALAQSLSSVRIRGLHQHLGEAMLLKGDVKAALAEIQQEPAEGWRLAGLSMAYHALGRRAERTPHLTN